MVVGSSVFVFQISIADSVSDTAAVFVVFEVPSTPSPFPSPRASMLVVFVVFGTSGSDSLGGLGGLGCFGGFSDCGSILVAAVDVSTS